MEPVHLPGPDPQRPLSERERHIHRERALTGPTRQRDALTSDGFDYHSLVGDLSRLDFESARARAMKREAGATRKWR